MFPSFVFLFPFTQDFSTEGWGVFFGYGRHSFLGAGTDLPSEGQNYRTGLGKPV
jgi:hypothetical protein